MSQSTILVIRSLILRGEQLSIEGNKDGSSRAAGPRVIVGPQEIKRVELQKIQFDQQFLDTLATYVDRNKLAVSLFGDFGTVPLTADQVRELRRRDLSDLVGGAVATHPLVGIDHSASGLTPGDVLTAITPTTFGFTPPGILFDFPFMPVGRNSVVTNSYLRGPGSVPTNIAGFKLGYNATIVGIGVATNGPYTWVAEVRKNGSPTVIASLSVSAAASAYVTSLSVDISAGDIIQMYCNGTTINRPQMLVYYKRR